MAPRTAMQTALAVLVAVLVALGGCARSAPTRFYVLRPLAEVQVATAREEGPSVKISNVVLPRYVDRPEIVAMGEGSQVIVAEFDRWAEPLNYGLPRVLAMDLAALLPSDRVSAFSSAHLAEESYKVNVDILRFDLTADGHAAVLDAVWSIADAEGTPLVTGRRSSIREQVAPDGYAAYCAAQSRAVLELSRQIAAAIGSLEG